MLEAKAIRDAPAEQVVYFIYDTNKERRSFRIRDYAFLYILLYSISKIQLRLRTSSPIINYSTPFKELTISRFFTLREKSRLTRMDTRNVPRML